MVTHRSSTLASGPHEYHETTDITDDELRSLLSCETLMCAFRSRIPWSPPQRLTHRMIMDHSDSYKPFLPILQRLSLLAQTEKGRSRAFSIDFTSPNLGVLPDATADDFPSLALGLILILDQFSLGTCTGHNARYTRGFFHPLGIKLWTRLRDLPPHLVPWNRERWITAPASNVEVFGSQVDIYLIALLWFLAPAIHCEEVAHHVYHGSVWRNALFDPLVRQAYADTPSVDPWAISLERGPLLHDTKAMSRELRAGVPDPFPLRLLDSQKLDTGHTVEMSSVPTTYILWLVWYRMVFAVHLPILHRFGRFPFYNRSLGRASTAEETKWLEETAWFAVIDEEDGRRIWEDVENGIWPRLELS